MSDTPMTDKITHSDSKLAKHAREMERKISKIRRDALLIAAEIAGRHAIDDDNAANSTTDLDLRLTCMAQRERAVAIQKAILVEANREAGV